MLTRYILSGMYMHIYAVWFSKSIFKQRKSFDPLFCSPEKNVMISVLPVHSWITIPCRCTDCSRNTINRILEISRDFKRKWIIHLSLPMKCFIHNWNYTEWSVCWGQSCIVFFGNFANEAYPRKTVTMPAKWDR